MHEHCRPDRDEFVFVNENNIKSGKEGELSVSLYLSLYLSVIDLCFQNPTGNFKKFDTDTVDTQETPYDYGSIMHYPDWAFQYLFFILMTNYFHFQLFSKN